MRLGAGVTTCMTRAAVTCVMDVCMWRSPSPIHLYMYANAARAANGVANIGVGGFWCIPTVHWAGEASDICPLFCLAATLTAVTLKDGLDLRATGPLGRDWSTFRQSGSHPSYPIVPPFSPAALPYTRHLQNSHACYSLPYHPMLLACSHPMPQSSHTPPQVGKSRRVCFSGWLWVAGFSHHCRLLPSHTLQYTVYAPLPPDNIWATRPHQSWFAPQRHTTAPLFRRIFVKGRWWLN